MPTALQNIGRYFAAVSWLSGLVIVLVPLALIAAGAPTARPNAGAGLQALKDIELAELGIITVLIAVVGQILLPLQFGITQVLEGYWGSSEPALRASGRSSGRHLRRLLDLQERQQILDDTTDERLDHLRRAFELEDRIDNVWPRWRKQASTQRLEPQRRKPEHQAKEEKLQLLVERLYQSAVAEHQSLQAVEKEIDTYPADPLEVMPTRLGNTLRKYERMAGQAYCLDAVAVVPLLTEVVSPTLRETHDDARTGMDVAIRMVVAWAIAGLISLALLWQYDVWMLVTLACSAMVWLSYLGAVAAAEEYGNSLVALLALGRFDLYKALNLRPVSNSKLETAQNDRLAQQLAGVVVDDIYYSKQIATTAGGRSSA